MQLPIVLCRSYFYHRDQELREESCLLTFAKNTCGLHDLHCDSNVLETVLLNFEIEALVEADGVRAAVVAVGLAIVAALDDVSLLALVALELVLDCDLGVHLGHGGLPTLMIGMRIKHGKVKFSFVFKVGSLPLKPCIV